MFKILVLKSMYNLSDDNTELLIRDRLSFQDFLGLRRGDTITASPATDRYFDEDKHVVLHDWGEAWTVLTNMALSLGQMLWREERTLKEVRERCYIDPVPTAKKLGRKKQTC